MTECKDGTGVSKEPLEETQTMTDPDGWTRLHRACVWNEIMLVEKYLAFGDNIDAQTKDNMMSPLMIAAGNGHVTLVQKLVDAKANLNLQNWLGNTALAGTAMRSERQEITKLLFVSKADASILCCNGWTALQIAKRCKNREVVAMLEAKPAPPAPPAPFPAQLSIPELPSTSVETPIRLQSTDSDKLHLVNAI